MQDFYLDQRVSFSYNAPPLESRERVYTISQLYRLNEA